MTCRERTEYNKALKPCLESLDDDTAQSQLVELVGGVLVDWCDVRNARSGEPVPFDVAALPDVLTAEQLLALACCVRDVQYLSEGDAKKFDTPSQTTAAPQTAG